MRSKSSGVESPVSGVLGVPQGDHDISQEQEVVLPVKSLMAKVQQKEADDKVEVEVISPKEKLLIDSLDGVEKKEDIMDLSKKDLLKLLGIMEGEVQVGLVLFPIVCDIYSLWPLTWDNRQGEYKNVKKELWI